MKIKFTLLSLLFGGLTATAQIPINAVDTILSSASRDTTYLDAGDTYNWGLSPNDTVVSLYGFNAGSVGFTYVPSLAGSVKLRRINNSNVSGNFTLEWIEASTTGSTFNMYPPYENSLDTFLNNNTYNKGTDNLFANTGTSNINNIERLDWVLTNSFATPLPKKVGFAVFDKGTAGTHDPFCIAAITSVDGSGNPLSYGSIVRVTAANYGEPGISVNYRIVKSTYPNPLLDAPGASSQSLGGVFISLQALGIAPNTPIFGYSLFGNDLPGGATPGDLLNVANTTNFPTNTNSTDGGLDLVAVTGVYISNVVLPENFTSFNAVENNDNVNLKWAVENSTSVQKYEIERSEDGIHFSAIKEVRSTVTLTGTASYSLTDNISAVPSDHLYYRIKQYQSDGTYYYSKTIVIRRNGKAFSILLFPNPVNSSLYINVPGTANDKAIISISNAAGAQVLMQEEQLAHGNNSFTIDGVGKLAKGVYQLSVKWRSSGKMLVKQFTKQ